MHHVAVYAREKEHRRCVRHRRVISEISVGEVAGQKGFAICDIRRDHVEPRPTRRSLYRVLEEFRGSIRRQSARGKSAVPEIQVDLVPHPSESYILKTLPQ